MTHPNSICALQNKELQSTAAKFSGILRNHQLILQNNSHTQWQPGSNSTGTQWHSPTAHKQQPEAMAPWIQSVNSPKQLGSTPCMTPRCQLEGITLQTGKTTKYRKPKLQRGVHGSKVIRSSQLLLQPISRIKLQPDTTQFKNKNYKTSFIQPHLTACFSGCFCPSLLRKEGLPPPTIAAVFVRIIHIRMHLATW